MFKSKDISNNILISINDKLEEEFETKSLTKDIIISNKNLPTNYGNKWTEEEKNILIKMLKGSTKIVSDDDSSSNNKIILDDSTIRDKIIIKIANKLGRTEGGVKGEIKKIVFDKYMKGEDAESISKELNLVFKSVKSIIKIYLEKECDIEINNLEKENKLLKLKIENINLRNELKNMITLKVCQ
jgi:hypothetical protein